MSGHYVAKCAVAHGPTSETVHLMQDHSGSVVLGIGY